MGGEDNSQINRGQLLKRFMYASPFVLGFLMFWLLNVTSPLNVGPAGILGVFLVFYVFCLSVFFLLIGIVVKLLPRIGIRAKLEVRKIYYLATVVAFLPVFLLALNSIGQLSLLDIVLVGGFTLVAGFYVVRRTD